MTGRVQDKVTVITGGASGIGEGMVRRFCSEGARVLLADIETDAGQRIADECDARFVQLDVSNERDWDALEKIVCSEYGRLDILLNNAGIVAEKSILEIDLATWNHLLSINLTGVMLGCRSAVRLMAKNPGGSGGAIVNTASVAGEDGQIGQAAYSASKAGVIGMTLPIARDLMNEGVRVNTILPGIFDTPLLAAAPQNVRDALADLPGDVQELLRVRSGARGGQLPQGRQLGVGHVRLLEEGEHRFTARGHGLLQVRHRCFRCVRLARWLCAGAGSLGVGVACVWLPVLALPGWCARFFTCHYFRE